MTLSLLSFSLYLIRSRRGVNVDDDISEQSFSFFSLGLLVNCALLVLSEKSFLLFSRGSCGKSLPEATSTVLWANRTASRRKGTFFDHRDASTLELSMVKQNVAVMNWRVGGLFKTFEDRQLFPHKAFRHFSPLQVLWSG